jgi:hypothetical protein
LTGRSTWTDDQDAIFTLPDCPASEILRNRFGRLGGTSLIERWVNWGVGEHDRRRVYGRTAAERAKKRLRVQHCEDPDLRHYGELRLDGRQLKAFISTGQSPGRTMFTLGHELGHAAIYRMNSGLDQQADGTERLCDLFAAELTMPVALVEDIWCRMPDARAIIALAKVSQGSLSASCIRIAELHDDITTGLASSDGFIFKHYGSISAHDLRFPVTRAYRRTFETNDSWIISDGIAAHVSATTKSPKDPSLIAFIARRKRLGRHFLPILRNHPSHETSRLWLAAGDVITAVPRHHTKILRVCGGTDVSVTACKRGIRIRTRCGRIWRRGGPRGGSGCCSPAGP